MSKVYFQSAGIIAPGLDSIELATPVLLGDKDYNIGSFTIPTPELLPPTERRRSTRTVKIALSSASQALAMTTLDVKDLNIVFGSSDGDGDITDSICKAIWESTNSVSPTKFSNSVHNAPAGYFSIATGDMNPSISICAYDRTFEMSLIEAVSQIVVEKKPVLLVVYDVPYNKPLYFSNVRHNPLAVAFIMTPDKLDSQIEIDFNISPLKQDLKLDTSVPQLGNGLENALVLLKDILKVKHKKSNTMRSNFPLTESLMIDIKISGLKPNE